MYTVSGNGTPSTELDHVTTQTSIVKNNFFYHDATAPVDQGLLNVEDS
jgi:hypothetical protein